MPVRPGSIADPWPHLVHRVLVLIGRVPVFRALFRSSVHRIPDEVVTNGAQSNAQRQKVIGKRDEVRLLPLEAGLRRNIGTSRPARGLASARRPGSSHGCQSINVDTASFQLLKAFVAR